MFEFLSSRHSWFYQTTASRSRKIRDAILYWEVATVERILKRGLSQKKVHKILCGLIEKSNDMPVCTDIVSHLIAHCDPKYKNSEALLLAVQHTFYDAVELLSPLSDCHSVLQHEHIVNKTLHLHNNSAHTEYGAHFLCMNMLVKHIPPQDVPSSLHNALAQSLQWSGLVEAVQRNDMDYVQQTISLVPSGINGNRFLSQAIVQNNLDMLRALVPFSDPVFIETWPIVEAAALGHSNIVEYLLTKSDPKWVGKALIRAVEHDHLSCVTKLIAHANRSDQTSALLEAVIKDHMECIYALLPFADTQRVFEILEDHDEDCDGAVEFRNILNTLAQRKTLEHAVADKQTSTRFARKM